MTNEELERVIESILFVSGEPVATERLAFAAKCSEDQVRECAKAIADRLSFERRGIRVLKLEDSWQMVSDKEQIEYVTLALETRKPPKLSPAQLETLTIIAYYQPATKACVEQLRGVDSAYSISALLNKKLIEECGRLNVPGRPLQYQTTSDFLRCFGLSSLEDLPEIQLAQLAGNGKIAPSTTDIVEGQTIMETEKGE